MWVRGGVEERGSRKEAEGIVGEKQVVEEGCKVVGSSSMSWPLCTREEGTGKAQGKDTQVKENESGPQRLNYLVRVLHT